MRRKNENRLKRFSRLSAEELRYKDGLNKNEVEERRRIYGDNRMKEIKKDTFGFRLRRAFVNPFSVVLSVLAVISFIVDVVIAPETGRNYTTVIIIFLMLAVSGFVRLFQELKSKKITDKLLGLVDATVEVRRDGAWASLEIGELVVGDLVRLSAGERVPADIRLIKVKDCFISESAITGESDLQEKTAEKLSEEEEKQRLYKNIAFCGTTVVNGSFEGVVVSVGNDTVYGKISPVDVSRKQGYDRGTNSIARVLIRFMALLVPLVFVAVGLTKGNWLSAFLFALSVAVGLTPELLPMVITACLAKGSFNMGQKQTVVKNVNAMQAFGSMDVLCVDKTGTLTEDTLILEYYMDILGNEEPRVLDSAYLNSFFSSGIGNPLDTAILKAEKMPDRADYYSSLLHKYEKTDELPFDYSKKTSTVLLEAEEGSVIIAKGSVDEVLKLCSTAFYKGKKIPIDEDGYRSVHAVVDEMAEDGMKVLAVAVKETEKGEVLKDSESALTLLGYLAFFDAPKKTAASAIKKLTDLQVETKVLTGDSKAVAVSVCRRLGMETEKVLTGAELDALSDNEIQMKAEETCIFAELTPSQKAKIIDILQSNGHTVGFLGDGMNDLPSVLNADVGISVDTAVSAVKEGADVILLKKDLNVLESGITEGRRAFANMSKYVKITASSNLGNIIAVVIAGIFLPFLPMTSIQLLLLNLLYDILCLVLPWDSVDPEMYRKPLEWSGKTLSRFMLIFGPISSVFDVITFLFLFCFLCPQVCGGPYGLLSAAAQLRFTAIFQTGWFLESMWTQVLILHLLRTGRLPFIESKPSTPVFTVTLLGIVAFTLLALTPIGSFIGLTGLPPVYFAFLLVDVFCYLIVVTLAKRSYMKRYHSLV